MSSNTSININTSEDYDELPLFKRQKIMVDQGIGVNLIPLDVTEEELSILPNIKPPYLEYLNKDVCPKSSFPINDGILHILDLLEIRDKKNYICYNGAYHPPMAYYEYPNKPAPQRVVCPHDDKCQYHYLKKNK